MRGFSLIELMIVLAIIALLLIFSVQGYQSYFARLEQQHAKIMLYSIAEALETYYQKHHTYEDANLAALGVQHQTLTIKNYEFLITKATKEHFTINAYPKNLQLKYNLNCKILSLNDIGRLTCDN